MKEFVVSYRGTIVVMLSDVRRTIKLDKISEFNFKMPKLPSEISMQYEIVSVLSWKKKSRVFLVTSKEYEKKYIIKYGKGKRAILLKNEYEILSKRDYPFLPGCISVIEKKNSVWLIREYIEGKCLSDIVEENDPFSLDETISCMKKVCDCINVFHEEVPPLLHRDIKPDNILIKPDGSIVFIDLDTVRKFDEDKNNDTIYVGTKETAAPEQFGYKQTSVRTDIYSLGILLLFLLTGKYRISSLAWATLPREVKKVISKCVAFDPEDRYSSVKELKRELSCLKRFKVRRRVLGGLVAGALCILTLSGVGIVHGVRKYRYEHDSVIFSEPLVEKAVRETLFKEEMDVITEQELSGVTTLIICHDQIFSNMEDHQRYHDEQWFEFEESGARTEAIDISDLKKLTGLKYLVLDDCGLEDTTDLNGIEFESLSIRKNNIVNIDFLKGMDTLKELVLDRNPISDISVLSSCKNLQNLRIQNTLVTDISPLNGLSIVLLDMVGSPVEDRSIVNTLSKLKKFFSDNMSDADVESLKDIKGLLWLGIYSSEINDMNCFVDQDKLENIDLSYCENIKDVHWVTGHSALDYLGLAHTSVTDISDISSCKMLSHLDISGTPVKDLSVLKSLPRLETIYIDSAKEGLIANLDLSADIEVVVTE